jgi:hypothetical protein
MSAFFNNLLKKFAMKKLLLVFSAFVSFQCTEELKPAELSADQFVDVVKNGEYQEIELPPFGPGDISVLLSQAQPNRAIAAFAVNPISSYAPVSYTLTESLLWTVEAIRLDNNPADRQLPFPSLAPKLRKKDAQDKLIFATEADYSLAYQAYVDWWEDNTIASWEDKQIINPLESLNLFWY